MQKVAYFLSHPIQYFSPLLRQLAEVTDLDVYYFSDASIKGRKDEGFGQNVKWDIPLLEGYKYTFIKNYSPFNARNNRFFDLFNPGVLPILFKKTTKIVIVNDWTYSSSLMCIFFGKLLGKKIWLRAEGPLNQELRKSKAVLRIKKVLLKYILFRFFIDRFLYIGSQNKQFFEYYGVALEKLTYTPYSVDNDFFSDQYQQLKGHEDDIKRKLGLPVEKKILLFSGKYIQKKRPLDLLKAFHQINNENYALVMVGDGELREEMRKFIEDNQLKYVYLTGFINQSIISNYYIVADVFVMCSGMGETWGLSVNEAMNFEKPVIVSLTCGSAYDLVQFGSNGYYFEEGDITQLGNHISSILENDEFRRNAGKISGKIIQRFSNEYIVRNLQQAINKAYVV